MNLGVSQPPLSSFLARAEHKVHHCEDMVRQQEILVAHLERFGDPSEAEQARRVLKAYRLSLELAQEYLRTERMMHGAG